LLLATESRIRDPRILLHRWRLNLQRILLPLVIIIAAAAVIVTAFASSFFIFISVLVLVFVFVFAALTFAAFGFVPRVLGKRVSIRGNKGIGSGDGMRPAMENGAKGGKKSTLKGVIDIAKGVVVVVSTYL
jgi:hypothetical protein